MPRKALFAVLFLSLATAAYADCPDHGRGDCHDHSARWERSDDGGGQGRLIQPPTPTLSVTASQFTQMLLGSGSNGRALLALSTEGAGGPAPLPCGVAVYHYGYSSVDGRGRPATATGALMLPTGSKATCSGARPLLEYAHGTNLDRSYDIAALNDPANPAFSESALIAAMYAAHGYIVVAPNYVGYDTSDVHYHPYLVKAQQSRDMIDALHAARIALHRLDDVDGAPGPEGLDARAFPNHQLFLTGYSQGGYVAMATEQAMQRRGIHVTAASPGSGPYALAALVDYIFLGHPDLGAPSLGSLLLEGYQHSYGNVWTSPSQVFANGLYTPLPYATAAAAASSPLAANPPMFDALAPSLADITVMPSDAAPSADATLQAMFPATVLPAGATYTTPDAAVISQPVWTGLFDTTGAASPYAPHNAYGSAFLPLWASSFSPSGTQDLITRSYRADYLADALLNPDGLFERGDSGMPSRSATNGLRKDLAANDLRGYVPHAPTMLCGGSADPIVYYPLDTAVMQSEWGTPTPNRFSLDVDPQSAAGSSGPSAPFQALQQSFQAWKASTAAVSPLAELEGYHGAVGEYCALAAREFFAQF